MFSKEARELQEKQAEQPSTSTTYSISEGPKRTFLQRKRPVLKASAKQENPESGSLSQRFNKNAAQPPKLKQPGQEKEPSKRIMGEKKNLRTKPGPAAPPKNPPKPKQDKGLTPTFNRAAKGIDI